MWKVKCLIGGDILVLQIIKSNKMYNSRLINYWLLLIRTAIITLPVTSYQQCNYTYVYYYTTI